MFTLFKTLLLLVAAVLAILVLACLGANLYLQSQGVQARISQKASQALRTQVAIKSTSYTPWGGITLGKVTLAGSNDTSSIEIAKIRLYIPLIPLLFRKQMILTSVEIEEPIIKVVDQAGVPWNFFPEKRSPSPEKMPENEKPESSKPSSPSKPSSNPSKTTARQPFSTSLTKVTVSNGKFLLLFKDGTPKIIAENIAAKLVAAGDGYLRGPLTSSRIIIANSLFLKNCKASVSYTAQRLEANPILANLAGGQISGEFRCRFVNPQYEIKANLANVSLRSLLKEAGYDADDSLGSLQGNLWVYGMAPKLEPQGKGTLELLNGQLKPVDFLCQLGQILRIQELEILRLKKAVASFQIQTNRLLFDNIFLESDNVILKGTGPMKFDGHLDLSAQFLVNDRLYSQFQGILAKNLSKSSLAGYYEVPFHVSGRTSCPKTDLLEKLTGIRMRGNWGGFLQNLMSWPAPAPSSSPSHP